MALDTMVSPAEQHAMHQFFRARQYAVVGASADRNKFGNKVLRWYIDRHLNVTPVHPSQSSIEGHMATKTLGDVMDQAPNPYEALTGVSIITPPSVSLKLLQDAISDKRISGFWLQPGAADALVGM